MKFGIHNLALDGLLSLFSFLSRCADFVACEEEEEEGEEGTEGKEEGGEDWGRVMDWQGSFSKRKGEIKKVVELFNKKPKYLVKYMKENNLLETREEDVKKEKEGEEEKKEEPKPTGKKKKEKRKLTKEEEEIAPRLGVFLRCCPGFFFFFPLNHRLYFLFNFFLL